jgi:hypothetical protein
MTAQQSITNRLRAAGVVETIFIDLQWHESSDGRSSLEWSISIVTSRGVIASSRDCECLLEAFDSVLVKYNEQKEIK